MSGHCEHCAPTCKGGVAYGTDWMTWHIAFDRKGRWHPSSGCPACAERERIAEFVEQLPVMTAYHAPDARNLAYRHTTPAMVAAKIRGEV